MVCIKAFQAMALLIFLSPQTHSHFFPPYHELPPQPPLAPISSYPFYAPHSKILPHILAPSIVAAAAAKVPLDIQHSYPPITGQAIVITVHSESAAPAHGETPFFLQQSGSQIVPYRLIFSQFPPIVEGVVQRVQNYFSTYLGRPGQFPQDIRPATYPSTNFPEHNFPTNNFPAATIPTISTTQFLATTSTTTSSPLPSITTSIPTDADGSSPDISTQPQTPSDSHTPPNGFETRPPEKPGNENGSYKYESPSGRAFQYPKPSFERFTNKDVLYSKLQETHKPIRILK